MSRERRAMPQLEHIELQVAHENLQRWSRVRGGALPQCREEWKELLKQPWSEIRGILLDKSDEGQRLRSSHPFAGLVSEKRAPAHP